MEDNTIINFDKFLDNHSFSDEQLEKRKKNYKNEKQTFSIPIHF